MISNVGQQKLHSLVQSQGKAAVQNLVEQKDVKGLEQAGFSKLDALALLDQAQKQGLDAVFNLGKSVAQMGGPQNLSGAGQQGVSAAAGQKAAPNIGMGAFSAMAAAKGGTALDGVDAQKIKDFNLKGLSLPKEIIKIADQVFAGKASRIQVSGYSAPPSGSDYEKNTSAVLKGIADKLSPGLITSPTADKGSVDAMTTGLSLEKGLPVLSITAKDYVGYIDPSKFPPSIDQAKYNEMPKHVFGDGAKYNQATALASNAFVASGGRDVTVFDFMRGIEAGNPAVLLVDQSLAQNLGAKAVWDGDKNRVNNGSQYLAEQLSSFLKDGTLPHATVAKDGFGSFDKAWLDTNKAAIEKLVKVVPFAGAADVGAAADTAAAHIASFRQPDAKATLSAFAPADNDAIKGEFKANYAGNAAKYAALTSSQLASATKNVPSSSKHMALAAKLLDSVTAQTASHFASGKFSGLEDAALNKGAIKQHAGYVAGEIGRKFGIDDKTVRDAILPFLEKTAGEQTTTAQREGVASLIMSGVAGSKKHVGPDEGKEMSSLSAELKKFTGDDNVGYMFNQYGFGDADKALNRPGVYAGQAVLNFAEAIAGSPDKAKALLQRSLERPSSEIAKGLENPKTDEDLVAHFAARAAQAGWLVSKSGQGIVEAEKGKDGTKRLAPKNDLITDFDSLAAKKGWPEVAKDVDQVKTALWGLGVLN